MVHSLDRLARSLTLQEAALQQAWAAGGRVFAVDTGEVLAEEADDPVRTFVRQVLGAVSQLEAGMIRRRLRTGRLHKAEQGGYAHGAPPYGWRAEGGELVPHAAEQDVVAQMRELRREGMSFRQIADWLNSEGVPAKRGGGWHGQWRGRWERGGNRGDAPGALDAFRQARGTGSLGPGGGESMPGGRVASPLSSGSWRWDRTEARTD